MTYTIADHKGQLCIVDEWQQDFLQPERYRNYWPIGRKTADYPDWVGMTVRGFGGSVYELYDNGRRFPIQLVNGGETVSIRREVEPIKRPRWAKSYQDGQWRRY